MKKVVFFVFAAILTATLATTIFSCEKADDPIDLYNSRDSIINIGVNRDVNLWSPCDKQTYKVAGKIDVHTQVATSTDSTVTFKAGLLLSSFRGESTTGQSFGSTASPANPNSGSVVKYFTFAKGVPKQVDWDAKFELGNATTQVHVALIAHSTFVFDGTDGQLNVSSYELGCY